MTAPSFSAWLLALDPDKRKSTSGPSSWVGIFLSGVLVMAIAGLVPGTKEYFQLRFAPAFCLFLPPIAVGVIGGHFEQQGRLSLRAYGTTLFLNSILFQLYMGSLVSFSRSPGAALMGAFPVLLACYHGHLLHSAPAHPLGTLATALALLGNLALNHDPEHLVLMALIAPTALAGSLVLGQFSTGSLRERAERDALRQAVDAQMLSDRTHELQRVASSVTRLRSHNHDAGNTLSSTLINAQLLVAQLERHQTANEGGAEALAITQDLWQGLKTMKALLETAREVGIEEQLSFETVGLSRIVHRVVKGIATRYRNAQITAHIDAADEGTAVSVAGGETSLDRMLQNLVINAVQGNGVAGATRVEVRVLAASIPGQASIVVRDDGPGFSAGQLEAQLSGFTTTKANGTGLGLYTTDRLARASRGSLTRANGASGGAVVALNLKLAVARVDPSEPTPFDRAGAAESSVEEGAGAAVALR